MSKSDIAIQSNIWENNLILREKRQNNKPQNYMPFLFRSKRQTNNLNKKSLSPPVGSYEIPSAFDVNNKSLSQPDFIKHQLQLKNQMGIFKSNQKRFTPNKSHMPGPATYNCLNNQSHAKFTQINHSSASNKLQQKNNLIHRSPSCPTIPDSKVRFGYVKDSQGNYKLIQKTENQIQKQKLKLKQYLSTLDGQNQFMKRLQLKKEPYLSQQNKKQQAILNNLQKYVDKRSTSQSRILSANKNKDFARLVKPKINLSYGVNITKRKQDNLGPGSYNVSLDTLKKAKKDENFQFFSSSEVRFTPAVKQNSLNPYEYLFKEKKNLNMKQKVQGKIFKKSYQIDPQLHEQNQLPGPGYYDPQIQNVKKSKGNIKFGYESRFKDNMIELEQQEDEGIQNNNVSSNEKRMIWRNLKKDKIKSPHKEFIPVGQSEIYGIMNQQQSSQNISHQKLKINMNKRKQSAVFKDKSCRLDIGNKTNYLGVSESNVSENSPKLWETKGSFMSRVSKSNLEIKQNTPGPGSYQKLLVDKKNFNIKNQ